MSILELRAARAWSISQTADAFLVTPATIASWMKRLDEDVASGGARNTSSSRVSDVSRRSDEIAEAMIISGAEFESWKS